MYIIKIVNLILLLLCLQQLVSSQNYCDRQLCRGVPHIGCRHNGRFAASCPRDARLININIHIQAILNSHNAKRNQIANGQLPRYTSARRMGTMQWDNELSYLAGLNVRQCIMRHDQCRNTNRHRNSGQNLAIFSYSGNMPGTTDAQLVLSRIEAWWREHTDANMSHINRYTTGSVNGRQIGHFTVMVSERNNFVGCAAARFSRGGQQTFLMACNYAYTNMINQPIYVSGPTGSGCRTGRNNAFRGLCSVREVF